MKAYRPKYLIDGERLDAPKGTSWVAVPEKFKGQPFKVEYGGTSMLINDWQKDAVMIKTFADKFATPENGRPKYYHLGYFEFVPDEINAVERR